MTFWTSEYLENLIWQSLKDFFEIPQEVDDNSPVKVGLWNGDVKLENILIDSYFDKDVSLKGMRIKLADFANSEKME